MVKLLSGIITLGLLAVVLTLGHSPSPADVPLGCYDTVVEFSFPGLGDCPAPPTPAYGLGDVSPYCMSWVGSGSPPDSPADQAYFRAEVPVQTPVTWFECGDPEEEETGIKCVDDEPVVVMKMEYWAWTRRYGRTCEEAEPCWPLPCVDVFCTTQSQYVYCYSIIQPLGAGLQVDWCTMTPKKAQGC
jgi:hypothetical protein